MKIAIGDLQSQDLLTEVDSSTGKSILGGDSINASFKFFASSNSSKSLVRGRIFGVGDDLLANLTAEVQTGDRFSRGGSFLTITSN